MKHVKGLMLFLIAVYLTGCSILSTSVSKMGLHNQTLEIKPLLEANPTPETAVIKDYRFMSNLRNHGTIGLPYRDIAVNRKTEEKIPFNVTPELLNAIKNRNETVMVKTEENEFLFEYYSYRNIEYYYRTYRVPAGYALQSLQLVAIPIDITLSIFFGLGLAIHESSLWVSSLFESPNQTLTESVNGGVSSK